MDPLEEILWLSQDTIEDRESSGPLPPAKAFVKSPRGMPKSGAGREERDASSERLEFHIDRTQTRVVHSETPMLFRQQTLPHLS